MKKILIVESPAKIKTIKKFLGPEFHIMSTMGHIKDLPPKKLGVTVGDDITIDYATIEGKDKVIAEITREAKNADAVYIAPDPDREGELIAWHVAQDVEKVIKNKDAVYRITFNEITKPAIINAIEHPSTVDMEKVNAQQARRVLDRWVGYEVSPILWKKIAPGLSAGRVQSVALRLICDREQSIRDFKPEEYWSIEGIFGQKKETFSAMLSHIGKKKAEIKDQKTAEQTVADIQKESYIIDSIEDKIRNKNPLPPFMTSTLQQAAYNKLGFSVKKTMQVAQQLYEGIPLDDPKTPVALITYMRTDSLRLSDTALSDARSYIKKNYTEKYLPPKALIYEGKSKGKAQDAHEAIRPINAHVTPDEIKPYVTADAAKLYHLIWTRFIACQMTSAQYAQRNVTLIGGKFTFKVTGSTLIFDGFLKLYGVEEDDEDGKVQLPANLREKDPSNLNSVNPKQHFTQPPARYTEASLVKEMEKEGIGRPSTYATILNTIRARSYTTLDSKKRFIPTELGVAITTMLVENLAHIMDKKFTAHMEEDLDKIANGELDRDTLLKEFYQTFQKDLTAFRGEEGGRKTIPTDIECPECHKNKLSIRFGKAGEFLGCMGYPECKFTSNFSRDEQGTLILVAAEKPVILEEKCPQCGNPLREVKGKFGMFVSCSAYPECKFIKQEKADVKCPEDGSDLVKRAWRGGTFWGCSNYPKCKFALFDEIEKRPCPSCNYPILSKKIKRDGSASISCINKKCTYKE